MGNQKTSQGFSRKVILSFDNLAGFPTEGKKDNLYYDSATGKMYYWNSIEYKVWAENIEIIDTVQPTPTATGNTTNLNKIFKDASGTTWFVDSTGKAIAIGSVEIVTDFTAITNGFRFTNEENENDDVTFEVNSTDPLNTKVEVKLNGIKVAEFPLYTVNNDIQINNAGSEWDLTDDQITILETNGDSQTINFPYRCTVVANPNGTIDIKQNGVTIGTIPAPTADVPYSKMLFIDPVNGNDTTGTGSDNRMFKTIAKALTVANGSGYRIVLGAGTYSENITVSLANIDIVTVAGSDRGNTFINGTVTFTHTTSSSGIQGISVNNLVHSGGGSLYVTDCQVNTSFAKSSNGYLEVLDSDVVGVNITGAGQCVFIGGKQTVLTINHVSALVSVKDSNNLATTTVTAGMLIVLSSTGFASTTNGKAITASAGTTVLLSNSQFYGSTGLITGLTLSGSYGIDNVQFDKLNSALGTNISTIGWFDKLGIINPATITTATKMLVRDANGIVSEQLLPTGGLSEPSALWTTATTDPTATGNIGTLPRFVENTANGKKWYIDSTGVAKELGSTAESAPSLPVAITIGTQAQLDALADKTANAYYIVTDGTSKGDILIWEDTDDDGVGDIWNTYLVPTNQLEWNVLTNATGESAGTYTYNLTTDTWSKTADLEPLIPSVDDPSAVGGVKMIRRYLAPRSGNGATYILGESVAGHGRSASHMADNGSINAPTGGETKVSKSPFTYYQTNAPYSILSNRDAWADDAQYNQAGGVAIDDIGILYYKGTAAFLTAITGSDTGISTSISSALIPDKFWANKSVKVVKYWLSYNTNNIIAHCGDGTIWVRGVNGASGIYGDGVIVADKLWHKVNLPQKPWKKIYITYDGLACGALAADGTFYVWGSNTTKRIAGTTTAVYSTPFQVTGIGAISDFAMDSNSVMVIANGVRWGIGTNNAGKLGNGNTTAIASYTQLPSNGFTFDKIFSMDDGVSDSYYYITTDKKAVHTGNNGLNFSSSPVAATVLTPTLMGNGIYQGAVVDIRAYTNASLIQTNQGEVWTCVNASGSNNGAHGWGINTVSGVGLNVFKKVPIPSLVVGVQSSESTSFQPQFTVLTDRGCIYTWGMSDFQYDNATSFAPGEVQISQFRQQTPKTNTQLDLLSLTASLSSVSNGSATSIFDGGTNQEVTFKVQYSGTPGVLSTTGWTITGADVVVTNIQPIIYVVATSGFMTFKATVASTDIPSLVIPNTQAQTYTINAGSLTTSISSTRVTDAIAGSLTTSFSAYQAAADDTYVAVTAAEYAAVRANIAGTGVYGASDSRMSVFTPDDGWGAGYTIVSSASANNLTIPPNTYPFAFSAKIMLSTAAIPANDGLIFKTTTANPPISGFSDWLTTPIVIGASLGNTTLYYVIKRPTNKTPATLPSFLAYYSPPRVKVSLNGIAGETGCYYAYTNVNTLGASLYSNSQPRIQTLGTTTKQW